MSAIKNLFMEIRQLEQQAIDGEINELDAYIEIDDLEKECKRAKDAVKDAAISQAENYGQKIFEHAGRKIEVRNKRSWYFDHIPDWNQKKLDLKSIEEKAKVAATSGLNASEETGEVIQPAIHKDSTYLAIIKKKE